MTDDFVPWMTCDADGCIGACLPMSGKCWAHAGEPDLDIALRRLGEDGELDARGVTVSASLWRRLLDAAPRGGDGHAVFASADFSRATFEHAARFGSVTFQGEADFISATFEQYAGFGGATFQGRAGFAGAAFRSGAGFGQAVFKSGTLFQQATFEHGAMFSRAQFKGGASFEGARFKGSTHFYEATFDGDALFRSASFGGDPLFGGVIVGGQASFAQVTFEQAKLVALVACRGLDLDGATFTQPVEIYASTPNLSCCRARFSGGVQFWVRWAEVFLDDADLSSPSILSFLHRNSGSGMIADEQRAGCAWTRRTAGGISEQPRLFSLQRANVAGLVLSGIDLTECRFGGAHNLEKMRMEPDVILPAVQARPGQDRRLVIAEERAWRAARHPGHWKPPSWPDQAGHQPDVLEPGQIAGIYRVLRKGREDNNDEPGAADFYYGEMEMRRHACQSFTAGDASGLTGTASRGRAERGILTVYWLVSGYGLRAWRAIACLAGLLAVFAAAFSLIGFAEPPQPASYWTSLLYAFRATLSLTDDQVKLTAWGSLLQAALRLTGPVLFGLALLALRNRVKR